MRLNVDEALRYLGIHAPDADMHRLAEDAARAIEQRFTPRYVLREYPVVHREDAVELSGAGVTLTGHMACRMLESCHHAAVLVCTLGVAFDSFLRTEQTRDMARAVVLNSCGSAYVEAGCDAAEAELRARHPDLYLTDRFSPGYGDLPLEVQRSLLTAADAARRLGVVAADSHLMNPSKSVTAVIGLSDEMQRARIRGCAYCMMKGECAYRERGETCGA